MKTRYILSGDETQDICLALDAVDGASINHKVILLPFFFFEYYHLVIHSDFHLTVMSARFWKILYQHTYIFCPRSKINVFLFSLDSAYNLYYLYLTANVD